MAEGDGGRPAGGAYEGSPFVAGHRPRLLHRAVPVTAQLDGYERASLGRDVVAGLTVAALAIPASMGLVSLADWRAIRIASRADFVIGVAAMTGVVVFGVLEGILIAVGLSILHMVRRSARPHDAVLGWVPRLDRYADVKLHRSAQLSRGVVVYRLDDRLFFANADYVTGRMQEALAGSPTPVRWFVFDAEGLVAVDSTGVAALEAVLDDFERRGVRFAVARAKSPLRERFERAGLTARIAENRFFPTVRAAVEAGRTTPPDEGER